MKNYEFLRKVTEDNKKIMMKNEQTGEINPVQYPYIADEIIFFFKGDEDRSCDTKQYMFFTENEAHDDCWDSSVTIPDDWEECDTNEIEECDLVELREEVIANLDCRVYKGDDGDCPIENYDKSYTIKDLIVEDDSIVLVY